MKQPITGFHLDSENHWVADLVCGHRQHMRHDPPWMERPWILTEEGRRSRLGIELECKRCDEAAHAVAQAVREALLSAARKAGVPTLVAKRVSSPYAPGETSDDWVRATTTD